MKVIAINGSPRKNGNTAFALNAVGEVLTSEQIDFEIIDVGARYIHGCIACGQCAKNQNGKCSFTQDILNESLPKMREADGIILGSPVYYSGIAGTMKSFIDRAFYVAAANGGWFRHKVGAAVVAVRRSGGTMTFNALNHYFSLSEMIIPTSNYWNIIHGRIEGEAAQDLEGIQAMQVLGKNIAWLLKTRENSSTIEPPAQPKIITNFVR